MKGYGLAPHLCLWILKVHLSFECPTPFLEHLTSILRCVTKGMTIFCRSALSVLATHQVMTRQSKPPNPTRSLNESAVFLRVRDLFATHLINLPYSCRSAMCLRLTLLASNFCITPEHPTLLKVQPIQPNLTHPVSPTYLIGLGK